MKVKNGIASSVSLRMMPEHALGQRLEQRRLQQAELDAEEAEDRAVGGEREGDRIAEQQEDDQRREHQRRHVGDEERGHARSLVRCAALLRACAAVGSCFSAWDPGSGPRRKAMRLMSSEMPCSASSKKPTGISSLAGQRISPPALAEISPLRQAFDEDRPGQPHDDDRHRQQEEDACRRCRSRPAARRDSVRGDDVDADVLVVQQRVAGAEQEHRREQVPLQLEPGVRARVERIAHDARCRR